MSDNDSNNIKTCHDKKCAAKSNILTSKRHQEIFKEIVEAYIETGEPVGSRYVSKRMDNTLSPATIRNVMADMEEYGILCSEYTSSGRKPTEAGMRIFVDQIVEIDSISKIEEDYIQSAIRGMNGTNVQLLLETVSEVLSDLTKCVSLIIVPTVDSIVKHVDFVALSDSKAVVVIVTEDGIVENRLITLPENMPQNSLEIARNYINEKIVAKRLSLKDIRTQLMGELSGRHLDIDAFVKEMIKSGVCSVTGHCGDVIIRGQSNIFGNNGGGDYIENINDLFKRLHEEETIKTILDNSIGGHGFKVFIGSEANIFNNQNMSMVVSPYKTSSNNLIGVIGVFGDYRMQYSKAITLVNYTASILKKIV